MSKLHILLKLAITIAVLVAVFQPSKKMFNFFQGNDSYNHNQPSDTKPNTSGARKTNEETVEIKPVAKHDIARRQIQTNSQPNRLQDFFLDGCSKSEFETSIKVRLETLLLDNEKRKTAYVEEKLALKKSELKRKMNETEELNIELKRLLKVVTEKKSNISKQLASQWQIANETIIRKSNEIRQSSLNVKNTEKFNGLQSQIDYINRRLRQGNKEIADFNRNEEIQKATAEENKAQAKKCCQDLLQLKSKFS